MKIFAAAATKNQKSIVIFVFICYTEYIFLTAKSKEVIYMSKDLNEEKNVNTKLDADGHVTISDEVVATIASIAAKSTEGVYGMVNTITGGFAEFLGMKNPSKGVKVQITDRDVKIDMSVIVEYGVKIPDVAWEIQDKVKSEVEAMTGLNVAAVNVSIDGVNMNVKPVGNTDVEKTTEPETAADTENAEVTEPTEAAGAETQTEE